MKWPRHHVNAKRNFKRSHPRVKLTPVQVFSCKRLLRMLLQYGHSNQDAEIVRSQRFLKTKILMVFLQTDQEHLWFNYTNVENFKTVWTYRICSKNSRERLFEGGDYFKHCYYQIKQTEHDMDFLSVPDLVPSLIFGAWIVTDQFCCIRFHFDLTPRG